MTKERSMLVVAVESLHRDIGALVAELQRFAGASAVGESALSNIRLVLGLLRDETKAAQTERPRGRFPGDHICESLRGQPVPGRPRAMKALVRLARHLDDRIRTRSAAGEPTHLEIDELAAIVMLAEPPDDAHTTARVLPLEIGK